MKNNTKYSILALLYFVALIVILSLFSSCSIFKKVNKTEVKTENKSDITTNQAVTTTETELTASDTTIRIFGSEISGSKPIQNILSGDSIVTSNNEVISIVTYNPSNGNISVKTVNLPKDIPIKIYNQKTKTTVSDLSTTAKTDNSAVAKTFEKKAVNIPFAWGLLIIPIGLIFLYRKKIIDNIKGLFS